MTTHLKHPKESMFNILVSAIGEDAARQLASCRGLAGNSFEFPKNNSGLGAKAFALLVGAVGEEAANKLIAVFGGDKIYIPKGFQFALKKRNIEIVRNYEKGRTVRQLSYDYNLSDRQIRAILKTTDVTETSEKLG